MGRKLRKGLKYTGIGAAYVVGVPVAAAAAVSVVALALVVDVVTLPLRLIGGPRTVIVQQVVSGAAATARR